ncbi:putative holin-like toxin [Paenibacillus faecis]
MISFSGLIIALLTLVVAIVVAINQNTKKKTAPLQRMRSISIVTP